MSEILPLRPIGSTFQLVEETPDKRIVYQYRVTGHTEVEGSPTEITQLLSVSSTDKKPPGPSERKSP